MPLTNRQRETLFAALTTRGWSWRGDFIYAPHSTMWLLGNLPWMGDLHDFHERMGCRLKRNEQAGWLYDDPADHDALVSDTRLLVDALAEMLSSAEGHGE